MESGPDVTHHVTQRGNNRQDVFFTEDDRQAYLDILREQSERFGLDILGYSLDQPRPSRRGASPGGLAGQGRRADGLDLHAHDQPPAPAQWTPLAEPLLLVRVRRETCRIPGTGFQGHHI